MQIDSPPLDGSGILVRHLIVLVQERCAAIRVVDLVNLVQTVHVQGTMFRGLIIVGVSALVTAIRCQHCGGGC